jgi:hypothetical protein
MILSPLVFPGGTLRVSMDKLKLTGRNLGRVYNSKLWNASLYAMQLHTKQNGLT